ncbi:MAG: T9SS type A sorting domain-containing protein, partial [Microcystis sp. LE19-196.1B]|nr:T9SS type A sorting domain-containing protein [Microcystis sp. LE19-196.1B]
GCSVTLIIKSNLIISNNIDIRNAFDKIIVENGATLTFSGKVTIWEKVVWEVRDSGKIEVTGQGIFLENGSELSIEGNNSNISIDSRVTTTTLSLNKNSVLHINPHAAIIVNSTTEIGNEVIINIKGFFRVGGNLSVTGAKSQLNVDKPGFLIINKNFVLSGNAGIKVSGKSEVEVGGDLTVNGNSEDFIVEDDSFVRVCGGKIDDKIINLVQIGGCRTLSQSIINFRLGVNNNQRSTGVHFSTVKEWEISHFEIERAINQVETWETVGSVEAVGFSDKITEYEFLDQTIPASGGMAYYRVKQLNLKGEFIYSEVKSTKIDAVKGNSAWKAYPNPSNRGTYIRIELMDNLTKSKGLISVKISDMVGTEVSSASFQQPKQVEEFVNQHLTSKNSGLYVINLSWDGNSEMIKLFIR